MGTTFTRTGLDLRLAGRLTVFLFDLGKRSFLDTDRRCHIFLYIQIQYGDHNYDSNVCQDRKSDLVAPRLLGWRR